MIQISTLDELNELDKPAVICFTNPITCAPCRALSPHFNNVSKVMSDKATFAEVDITQNMDLAMEFGVTATPTIIFVGQDGRQEIESRTIIPLVDEINTLTGE